MLTFVYALFTSPPFTEYILTPCAQRGKTPAELSPHLPPSIMVKLKKGPTMHGTLQNAIVAAINDPNYSFSLPKLSDWESIVSSSADEKQRLEFVGDAVMHLSVALYLYRLFPDAAPGLYTVSDDRDTAGETQFESCTEYTFCCQCKRNIHPPHGQSRGVQASIAVPQYESRSRLVRSNCGSTLLGTWPSGCLYVGPGAVRALDCCCSGIIR